MPYSNDLVVSVRYTLRTVHPSIKNLEDSVASHVRRPRMRQEGSGVSFKASPQRYVSFLVETRTSKQVVRKDASHYIRFSSEPQLSTYLPACDHSSYASGCWIRAFLRM